MSGGEHGALLLSIKTIGGFMKLLITLIFLSIQLISMGAVASYYVKLDADGYVVDMTLLHTDVEGYVLTEINEAVKPEHLSGYFKLVDGYFIIDEAKYQEWLAAQVESEEPEQPEQPQGEQ